MKELLLQEKIVQLIQLLTVRKVFTRYWVERIFLIHSPKIDSIEILRSSKVRRSKLYYLTKFKRKSKSFKTTI